MTETKEKPKTRIIDKELCKLFEIVEFYPFVKNPKVKTRATIIGSLHIFLIEENIDLRGIGVIQNKKNFYFKMPHYSNYDKELKKQVQFPILSFIDENKKENLFRFLQQEAAPYIKKHPSYKEPIPKFKKKMK